MGESPFNGTPEEWDALVKKNKLHKCKYCGVETTQPDDECYAKPAKELTAVDWLVENLSNHDKAIEIVEIIELANKMFEQQITNAYQKGFTRERGNRNEDAKQYYSETYKADEI